MNKDSRLLFEAYQNIMENIYLPGPQKMSGLNSSSMKKGEDAGEGICGQGCTCGKCPKCMPADEEKKSKHSQSHYHGAAHVVHHILKDKVEDEEGLAKHMETHMKKIYGNDYDPKKAASAIKKAVGSKKKGEGNEVPNGADDTEDEEDMNGDEDATPGFL